MEAVSRFSSRNVRTSVIFTPAVYHARRHSGTLDSPRLFWSNGFMQEKIKKITVSLADRTEVQKVPVDPSTQTDNSFDYSKVVVKKPWGYEYLMNQNAHMAVWILYIKKGNRTSMHCHPKKKTSLVVLSGEAICSTLGERMKRTTSEGLLMDKGVFHSTESVSDSGTFVMEIETPNHKRDLVRLEDKYGRVGKGYESVSEMSFNLDNYNYITFIESKIYYNVRKKFGTCSLSLAKFRTYEEFKNNFELKGWDAVSIVKGKILDGRGAVILDVGDTVDLETIKSFQNIQIDGEIEVIVIKRRDTMVKLSDYVVTFIEKEKVRDVFLVPGRPNAHIIDSIGRNTNMRYVCFKSEEAATMAAEGASKLSNRPAVVVLSSGASGTNALTGVADAWVDSTPLLVISGQTRTDEITSGAVRQLGIQELDIVQIVRPITKYAVRIEDANSIRYHLEKAVHLARTGRPGPVWIDLPSDLQGMDIDEDELKPFQPPGSPGSGGDGETDEKIEEAIRLVREAERPVLLAGNGIRLAGAQQSFLELVDRLALPVLTSRRGADLMPDDHPLFFGRPGTYGQRSANFVIQNADVILSIGSRLSLPQIGRNPKAFARAARLIVVDIDKHELGKPTIRPYQAICCSAGEMIRRMQEKLSEGQRRDISAWIQRCREWRSKYTEPRPNGHPPEDRLPAPPVFRIP